MRRRYFYVSARERNGYSKVNAVLVEETLLNRGKAFENLFPAFARKKGD